MEQQCGCLVGQYLSVKRRSVLQTHGIHTSFYVHYSFTVSLFGARVLYVILSKEILCGSKREAFAKRLQYAVTGETEKVMTQDHSVSR